MIRVYFTSNSNNADFFKYNDKIEIIDNPKCYFIGDKFYTNFDIVYTIDGNELSIADIELIELCKLNNIPIIGTYRYNKAIQYQILKNYDIYTPYTVYSNNGFDQEINANIALLNEINDDEEIIVKMILGARGWGQLKGKKLDILKLIYNNDVKKLVEKESCNETKYIEIDVKKCELEEKQNNIEEKYLENLEYNNISYLEFRHCIIQKYENNIQEYRVLLFYSGDKIVVERNKNNWQGNACNNDSGSSIVIDNKDIECTDFNLLEAKLRSIMKEYDYTCLSVDIFLNDKGFGVLEFQEEFGWTNTSAINSVELNKYMVNSLIKKVEDYGKK